MSLLGFGFRNAKEAARQPASVVNVVDYADDMVSKSMANGVMNTGEEQLIANVSSAIRRGHVQWRGGPIRPERVCLIGSGPSLDETFPELQRLVWEGAIPVTMNGAYHYCIERGLQPRTQIVMDARETNARFMQPAVPRCNYVLASQCAPAVWDAVEGRDHVWIFHAVTKSEDRMSQLLDDYYLGNWVPIGGGTTVVTRSINLLRTAGYVRFDLFGIDCCWKGNVHHAMSQPENAHDKSTWIDAGVRDRPETMRKFRVTPWQLKQLEDLLTIMTVNGKHFMLTAHGDGLFTHILTALGTDSLDVLSIESEA